jgi:hypothetical protein
MRKLEFEERVCPEPNSGCWLWVGSLNVAGYGYLWLPGRKQQLAHRHSYEKYKGPIPGGLAVCHKCDVRCCVTPDHLFLGTRSDNNADMIRKGRHKCIPQPGETNPMAKLNWKDVRRIRELRETGQNCAEIAKQFNITKANVWLIVTDQTWRA